MSLSKKRWLILGACCFLNLFLGSIYTWSIFAGPMAERLSVLNGREITAGDLALVYTLCNAVGPIPMITGGWFNDRFGPKKVLFFGGLFFSGGLFLSGLATSVAFLLFTYSLLFGLGLGMCYGTTVATAVKFFPDKRGLIGGLTTATYGMSSFVLPPILTRIIQTYSVTAAFQALGICCLGIILLCTFFIEKAPEGFLPEGYVPVAVGGDQGEGDVEWKQMVSTPVFYVMLALLITGTFSGMMFLSQTATIGTKMMGLSVGDAAGVISVVALFNTFGRLLAGFVSDRIGRIGTLAIASVVSFVGMLALFGAGGGSLALFYFGACCVGVCFGGFLAVFPGFTADQFGAKNNSVNYGIMFCGVSLGGVLGPTVMRNVYAADHSYLRSFLIAAAINAGGFVFTFIYRLLKKKPQEAK